MYARKVSLCLKTDGFGQFILKMESEILPLFRRQRGFLDQLVTSETGNELYVYSFWETIEDAEHYDHTTLPQLNDLLADVIEGVLCVHSFAGSQGRLSGNSTAQSSRRATPALLRGLTL